MKLGFLTGSMDGKPLAPLLPNRKEWSHYYQGASVGFSTSWLKAYDDHVAVVRFTPRAVDRTDAELFWLVHPDAKEGKDYDVKRIQALWGNTYREDRWICENQHLGVLSERYNFGGVGQTHHPRVPLDIPRDAGDVVGGQAAEDGASSFTLLRSS